MLNLVGFTLICPDPVARRGEKEKKMEGKKIKIRFRGASLPPGIWTGKQKGEEAQFGRIWLDLV
jgi:hypothetical protein